jgi:hypothetical protein
LFQEYQKCYEDTKTIVINQTGITIGNLRVLGPICMFTLMGLGLLLRCLLKPADDQERLEATALIHYTRTEKQKVLEALAIVMLVHRDHIIVERIRERNGKNDSNINVGGPQDIMKASMLRELVEDVVDHYNNPDTMHHVMEFLQTSEAEVDIHNVKQVANCRGDADVDDGIEGQAIEMGVVQTKQSNKWKEAGYSTVSRVAAFGPVD